MNSCDFIGKLLNNVTLQECEYGEGENKQVVPQAYFNLSVMRPGKVNGKFKYDSIPFKATGKLATFMHKYLKKGMRVGIHARAESSKKRAANGNWYDGYILRVCAVFFIDKPDYEMEDLAYDENLYVNFNDLG